MDARTAPDPAAFFAGLDVRHAPRELIALGGELEPRTLEAAYRAGCFPWPPSEDEEPDLDRRTARLVKAGKIPVLPGPDAHVPWCSPQPRAVLLPSTLRVSRSLRRTLRASGWHTTVDEAFSAVIAGCADRPETWITGRMRRGYEQLHAAGIAHSLEVWDGDELIGGLYGVLTGALFSGESMFHRRADASKVALVALVARMVEGDVRLLDTQQQTEHMTSLGQVLVSREDYLDALLVLRDRPGALPRGRRPVSAVAG
jgi:leucyl/phenylalanyl-tRNA--protein transferase